MPGTVLSRIWASDPSLYAPARYRRACRYHPFVPDDLATLTVSLSANLAGLVAEAERAVTQLNDEGGAASAPLARLLLRTESIASSKVEGMHVGVRELARAEARSESGLKPGSSAVEILANIDAMTLAVDHAADTDWFSEAEIAAIHQRLNGANSTASHCWTDQGDAKLDWRQRLHPLRRGFCAPATRSARRPAHGFCAQRSTMTPFHLLCRQHSYTRSLKPSIRSMTAMAAPAAR